VWVFGGGWGLVGGGGGGGGGVLLGWWVWLLGVVLVGGAGGLVGGGFGITSSDLFTVALDKEGSESGDTQGILEGKITSL